MKRKLLNQICIAMLITGAFVWGCKKDHSMEVFTSDNEEVAELSSNTAALEESISSEKQPMSYFNTYRSTDFASAGVGGLRDKGNGTINLPNTFSYASVTHAYLYWAGLVDRPSFAGQQINVNSSKVTGVRIGISFDQSYSLVYRADITTLLRSSSGRTLNLSGFGNLNPNGASIVVFYKDGNNSNNRDVVLFDGNDTNGGFDGIPGIPEAARDEFGWNVPLSGVNYTTGSAYLQLHVSDGNPIQRDGGMFFFEKGSIVPLGHVFSGTSVPGGGLWDIKDFKINSNLTQGINNLRLRMPLYEDYLDLIVTVFNLPAGSAPPSQNVLVPLDIRPDQCPNTFICSENGLVTVAIPGSSKIDVSTIDLPSLSINGIAPESSVVQDITSPYSGTATDCNTCSIGKPDGKADLVLKFDIQKVGKTLGNVKVNQCVRINLIGTKRTPSGTRPITGVDFITIKNPG
jgi:hypothetical protein